MTEIATPKPEEKEVSEMSIEDVLRALYQKIHFREMGDDEMSIVLQSLSQDPVETIMGMLQSPELISRLLNLNPSPEVASNALAYVFRAKKMDGGGLNIFFLRFFSPRTLFFFYKQRNHVQKLFSFTAETTATETQKSD